MTKPTYFLPPDFTNYPFILDDDSTPIKLGQLISAVDDPEQTVGSLKPLDPASYGIKIGSLSGNNLSHKNEAQAASSASLFLKAVQVIGLRFNIQVDSSNYAKLLSQIASFEARSFVATEDYVQASLEQEKVQTWIKKGFFAKRIFMVTGILIAKPVEGSDSNISASQGTRSEVSGDVEVSSAAAGQPGPATVSGGAASKRSKSISSSLSFVPGAPFIYGFRLRECFYRRGEASSKAYTKGAKLHAEVANEEASSVSGDTGEFVFSGIADEDLTPAELLKMDHYQDISLKNDLNGEMCSLVVSKA